MYRYYDYGSVACMLIQGRSNVLKGAMEKIVGLRLRRSFLFEPYILSYLEALDQKASKSTTFT